MKILIPLNGNDLENSSICLQDEVKNWVLIELLEGRIKSQNLFAKVEDISDWYDCVIVKNQNEYVWNFMEQGIGVLVTSTQETIEEIMEAFLFKELHEINS